MQKIKIGILDEEKEYVTNLCAYLQRYGKGKWDLKAFTSEELLTSYLKKKSLDVLMGTDRKSLIRANGDKRIIRMLLADKEADTVEKEDNYRKKEKNREKEENIYEIYRFQSAAKIGQHVDGIVRQECIRTDVAKQLVAVYSPVGRCGKTTLALEIVQSGLYGKWLYFGMEDYSSFQSEEGCMDNITDEVLYYWKERRDNKLLDLIGKTGNIIVSGSSFLDARQINQEDMKWFRNQIQISGYEGVIFDIGTGILQDFLMFKEFDSILVPYVEESRALIKKEKFESLFGLYEMEDYRERVCYLNMNEKNEVTTSIRKIFEGDKL